jgi:putative hydrolase of the HAD superfamily
LLTFDIDDTLYPSAAFSYSARENAVKAMIQAGLKMDLKEALAELDEVVNEFSSNDEHHLDRLLQRLPQERLGSSNPAILVASGIVAYRITVHDGLVLYEDAQECLKRLQAHGYRLGVVSQGWTIKQAEKVVRLKILPFLDKRSIYFTDQLGISKENSKFYNRVAELAGAPPQQCLHVGDRPDRDIDPANAAGWITVLSRRSGRYHQNPGLSPPAYTVQNFWDLIEIVEKDFEPFPGT